MQIQQKKGQAAMEFLMTYGWAILAAIIAIGVLAYFGVFSPGRFVQDSVFISAPLGAESAQALTNGNVSIELRNGAGQTITISNESAITASAPTTGTCSPTGGLNVQANSSGTTIVTFECSGIAASMTAGERFRGDITIRYTAGTAAFESTSTGSITQTIQAP